MLVVVVGRMSKVNGRSVCVAIEEPAFLVMSGDRFQLQIRPWMPAQGQRRAPCIDAGSVGPRRVGAIRAADTKISTAVLRIRKSCQLGARRLDHVIEERDRANCRVVSSGHPDEHSRRIVFANSLTINGKICGEICMRVVCCNEPHRLTILVSIVDLTAASRKIRPERHRRSGRRLWYEARMYVSVLLFR